MTGALNIITTTVPMIVATYGTVKVLDAAFKDKKTGKPVGSSHFHKNRKTKRFVSHRHTNGHIFHTHRGMYGYGKSKESFRDKK